MDESVIGEKSNGSLHHQACAGQECPKNTSSSASTSPMLLRFHHRNGSSASASLTDTYMRTHTCIHCQTEWAFGLKTCMTIAESFYLFTVDIWVVYVKFEKCCQVGFTHLNSGVRNYQRNNRQILLKPVKKVYIMDQAPFAFSFYIGASSDSKIVWIVDKYSKLGNDSCVETFASWNDSSVWLQNPYNCPYTPTPPPSFFVKLPFYEAMVVCNVQCLQKKDWQEAHQNTSYYSWPVVC